MQPWNKIEEGREGKEEVGRVNISSTTTTLNEKIWNFHPVFSFFVCLFVDLININKADLYRWWLLLGYKVF